MHSCVNVFWCLANSQIVAALQREDLLVSALFIVQQDISWSIAIKCPAIWSDQ